MWPEHMGSRGSQEIMSCLLKYIKSLPPTVTHLDAYSDNAGGQNKDIVKRWCFIVSNIKIQTVDHKFLVSGHLFLECDQGLCSHREMQKEELFLLLYLAMGMHSWRKLAEKLQYLKWARTILNPSTKCQNWWKAKIKALDKCSVSILRSHLRIHLFTKKHWTKTYLY